MAEDNVQRTFNSIYNAGQPHGRNYLTTALAMLDINKNGTIKALSPSLKNTELDQDSRNIRNQLHNSAKSCDKDMVKDINKFVMSGETQSAVSNDDLVRKLNKEHKGLFSPMFRSQDTNNNNQLLNRLHQTSVNADQNQPQRPQTVPNGQQPALNVSASQAGDSSTQRPNTVNDGYQLYENLSQPGQKYMLKNLSEAHRNIEQFSKVRVAMKSPKLRFSTYKYEGLDKNGKPVVKKHSHHRKTVQRTAQYLNGLRENATVSKNDGHIISRDPVPKEELAAVDQYVDNPLNRSSLRDGSILTTIKTKQEDEKHEQEHDNQMLKQSIANDEQNGNIARTTQAGEKLYNNLSPSGKKLMNQYVASADNEIAQFDHLINRQPNGSFETSALQRIDNTRFGIRQSQNAGEHNIQVAAPVARDEQQAIHQFLTSPNSRTTLASGTLDKIINPSTKRQLEAEQLRKQNQKFQRQEAQDVKSGVVRSHTEQGLSLYKSLSPQGQRLMSSYVGMADSNLGQFDRILNNRPLNDFDKSQIQRLSDTANGIRHSQNDQHTITSGEPVPKDEQTKIHQFITDPHSRTMLGMGSLDKVISPSVQRVKKAQQQKRLNADLQKHISADTKNGKLDASVANGKHLYLNLSYPGQKLFSQYARMGGNDMGQFQRVINGRPLGNYEQNQVQHIQDMVKGRRQSQNSDDQYIKTGDGIPDDEQKAIKSFVIDPNNRSALASGSLNTALNPSRTGTEPIIKPKKVSDVDEQALAQQGDELYASLSYPGQSLMRREAQMAEQDLPNFQHVVTGNKMNVRQVQQHNRLENLINGQRQSQNSDHHMISEGQDRQVPPDELKKIHDYLLDPKLQKPLANGTIGKHIYKLVNGDHTHDDYYNSLLKYQVEPRDLKQNLKDARTIYKNLSSYQAKRYMSSMVQSGSLNLTSMNRINYAPDNELSLRERNQRQKLTNSAKGIKIADDGVTPVRTSQPIDKKEKRLIDGFMKNPATQKNLRNGSMNQVVQKQNQTELEDMESRSNDHHEQHHSNHSVARGLDTLSRGLETYMQQAVGDTGNWSSHGDLSPGPTR